MKRECKSSCLTGISIGGTFFTIKDKRPIGYGNEP